MFDQQMTMCLLAADTSGEGCALVLSDQAEAPPADRLVLADREYDRCFFPALQGMMAKAGIEWRQLSALAVAVGPGSFSGTRAGVSALRGLALACHIPLVGIDSFSIWAETMPVTEGSLLGVALGGNRAAGWLDLFDARDSLWSSRNQGQSILWKNFPAHLLPDRMVGNVPEICCHPPPSAEDRLDALVRLSWRALQTAAAYPPLPRYLRAAASLRSES